MQGQATRSFIVRTKPASVGTVRGIALMSLWAAFICQLVIGQYYLALNDRLSRFTDSVFIESWRTVEVATTASLITAGLLGVLTLLNTANAIAALVRIRSSLSDNWLGLLPFFSSALGLVCVLWSAWNGAYYLLALNGLHLTYSLAATGIAVLLLGVSSIVTAASFCQSSAG